MELELSGQNINVKVDKCYHEDNTFHRSKNKAVEEYSGLPVIDIRLASNAETRPALTKKIFDTLKTTGFMYVEGVEGYESKQTDKWTKWFFALPKEEKFTLARKTDMPDNRNFWRGYFPSNPTFVSCNEGLELGPDNITHPDKEGNILLEDNPWLDLSKDLNVRFKEAMTDTYKIVQDAGELMMQLIAEGAGIDRHYFDHMFQSSPISTMRINHYPERPCEIPDNAKCDNGKVLVMTEHADSELLTFVDTFGNEGLQYLREDGLWVDIPHRPGAFICNIGEILSRISGGILKATIHRVLDIGKERDSFTFFLAPSYDADISKQMPITDKPAWTEPLMYGTYYLSKMSLQSSYINIPKSFPAKTIELANKRKVNFLHPEHYNYF